MVGRQRVSSILGRYFWKSTGASDTETPRDGRTFPCKILGFHTIEFDNRIVVRIAIGIGIETI